MGISDQITTSAFFNKFPQGICFTIQHTGGHFTINNKNLPSSEMH
jgi:hypothetical protein